MFVTIPNVLANRYASDEMVAIWSPEAKVVAERRLWLAVLRAQAELGVGVPDGVVADYERALDDVDLSSIAARERVTRHDVKARIEEFNALAETSLRTSSSCRSVAPSNWCTRTGWRSWRGSRRRRSATATW